MTGRPDDHEPKTRTLEQQSTDGRAWLLVVDAGSVEAHALPETGTVTIGRSRDCDIVIENEGVSRHHARLRVDRDLSVEDLGSVNGVRVRGRALARKESARVAPGETIQLGSLLLVIQRGSAYLPPPAAKGRDRRRIGQRTKGLGTSLGSEVVAVDPNTARMFEFVAQVAKHDINLLVLGETGVGKEVVARTIHRMSPRKDKPLVELNCAALPANLVESELFGHEQGAFTGADREKKGLLEAAEGGTFFLDEVGELSPEVQAKLLRTIEERSVRRVGSVATKPIDVRFVAATNVDLEASVAGGGFRADLYFRLNGITISVPPLRDRRKDIGPLARGFLSRAAGGAGHELGPEVLSLLEAYSWPGNVRQLKHVIERAVVLADGAPLLPSMLPAEVQDSLRAKPQVARPSLGDELRRIERGKIVEALEACSGNQTRAAKRLGMARRTFVSRLKEYGIPRPRTSVDED